MTVRDIGYRNYRHLPAAVASVRSQSRSFAPKLPMSAMLGRMEMPLRTKIAGHVPALALAAGFGAVAALSIALSMPERALGRSFASAFAEVRSSSPVSARPSGSGELLLSRHEDEPPLGWSQPVAAGDRMTITARDGRTRTLEVVEVSEVTAKATRVERAGEPRFLMVICKVVGAPDARPIRFVVEAEETVTPVPATGRQSTL